MALTHSEIYYVVFLTFPFFFIFVFVSNLLLHKNLLFRLLNKVHSLSFMFTCVTCIVNIFFVIWITSTQGNQLFKISRLNNFFCTNFSVFNFQFCMFNINTLTSPHSPFLVLHSLERGQEMGDGE